jgi:hypothetical protein
MRYKRSSDSRLEGEKRIAEYVFIIYIVAVICGGQLRFLGLSYNYDYVSIYLWLQLNRFLSYLLTRLLPVRSLNAQLLH